MTGEREKRVKSIENSADRLGKRLGRCDICPRNCRVNRLKGEKGYCGTDSNTVVYSSFLHRGEEPGISGEGGSGTIFFSGCSLKCVYCQNYKFSHTIAGKKTSDSDLAEIMLRLQKQGAHNINLVTPTHFLPQILNALALAFKNGLDLPIVYNTSGYEKAEVIKRLEGIVDIYLVDLKYREPALAEEYSNAPKYPVFASESTLEMNRQIRSLVSDNILKKGVVIRHLVLPGYINQSKELLLWIKNNVPQALTSIMFQYQPYFRARLYPRINRPINYREYLDIRDFTEELGLAGWVQEYKPDEGMAGPYFNSDI